MTTGFEDSQGFPHHLREPRHPLPPAASITVPRQPHEVDGGRRVGDEGIEGISLQLRQHPEAVTVENGATHLPPSQIERASLSCLAMSLFSATSVMRCPSPSRQVRRAFVSSLKRLQPVAM